MFVGDQSGCPQRRTGQGDGLQSAFNPIICLVDQIRATAREAVAVPRLRSSSSHGKYRHEGLHAFGVRRNGQAKRTRGQEDRHHGARILRPPGDATLSVADYRVLDGGNMRLYPLRLVLEGRFDKTIDTERTLRGTDPFV